MALYAYQAINNHSGKIKEGNIEAKSKSEAIKNLEEEGFSVFKLEQEDQVKAKKSLSTSFFSSKKSNLLLFTQQLANLLKSGIRLGQALKIVEGLVKDIDFKRVIKEVGDSLVAGKGFAETLANHPDYFATSYVNMVKAGEEGGFLALTFQRLAQNLEDNSQLKSFIISSLIYPAILLVVSIIAIIVMLTYVLPNFTLIYSNYGEELPEATQILLNLSGFLRSNWLMLVIILSGLIIAMSSYYYSEKGRRKIDLYLLQIPLVGDLIKGIAVTRICRSTGSMLESGVPLLKSLRVSSNVTSNLILQEGLQEVAIKVKRGSHLSEALDRSEIFPEALPYMVGVGEETGQLADILLEISENFEKSSKKFLDKFMKTFEPLVILFMGVSIGFIIISMLLPILGINNISF